MDSMTPYKRGYTNISVEIDLGYSVNKRDTLPLVAWLMHLAMLAAAGALVCVGYLIEKKRHNKTFSYKIIK